MLYRWGVLLCIGFLLACQGNSRVERATRALLIKEDKASKQAKSLGEAAKEQLANGRYAEARLLALRASALQPADGEISLLLKRVTATWFLRSRPNSNALLPTLRADRIELQLAAKKSGGKSVELAPIFRLVSAVEQIAAGQIQDARTTLESLKSLTNEQLEQQKAIVLFELGKLSLGTKSPEAAINYFREALAEEDGFWSARLQLSQLLSQKGEHKEAVEQIELVSKLKVDGIIRFVEGRIYVAAKEPARAVDAFSRALKFGNAPKAVHGELGQVLFQQKKYREAHAQFVKSYGLTGQLSDLFNQGMALKGLNAVAQSAAVFENVIQRQPNSGRAHVELISALMASKNLKSAQQALNRYLALKEKDKGLERVYPEILAIVKASEAKSEAANDSETAPDK